MRAREAWFELDLRADDPDALAARRARGGRPPRERRAAPCRGAAGARRPAGRRGSIREHPLVRAAKEALRDVGTAAVLARDEHRRERRARARHPGDRGGRDDEDRASTRPQEWIETGPIEDGRPRVGAHRRAVRGAVGMSLPIGRRAAGRVSARRVPVDGGADRCARLLEPVAHGLVAARPQFLRLPHACRHRVAPAAARHGRHEPAHASSGDHGGRGGDRRRHLRRAHDPRDRGRGPTAAGARDAPRAAHVDALGDRRDPMRCGPVRT